MATDPAYTAMLAAKGVEGTSCCSLLHHCTLFTEWRWGWQVWDMRAIARWTGQCPKALCAIFKSLTWTSYENLLSWILDSSYSFSQIH